MTEELKQKAYEYSIKEIPFIECITQNDLERLVQQAYIAGATENGIQWHDLRKDPNDLPEKIKLVLIRLLGCYVLGWYDGIDFYNDCNKGEKIPKELLIAWCEIPQFKESINQNCIATLGDYMECDYDDAD